MLSDAAAFFGEKKVETMSTICNRCHAEFAGQQLARAHLRQRHR